MDVISIALVIAMINPADKTRSTRFPSGVKEIDSRIADRYCPPVFYPTLTISNIYLSYKNVPLFPGKYTVMLSNDKQYLFFYQEAKQMLILPVVSHKEYKPVKKKKKTYPKFSSPSIELKKETNQLYSIIYKNQNVEAKTFLRAY